MRGALRAVALLVLGLGACAGESPAPAAPAAAVEAVAERGPVRLSVRAEKGDVTAAERFELTVEVRSQSGVDVEMPHLQGTLGPFEVHEARTPPDVPDGSLRVRRNAYTLSTLESGSLEIPALSVRFTDRRDVPEARTADGGPVTGELASEPLRLTVATLVGADPDPSALRQLKGAVEVPAPPLPWWWWAAGGALAAVAVAAVIWFVRRRRRARAEGEIQVILAPHEWARRELERLEQETLVEQERWQEYFFRLSGIVREYIERRFTLHAPERTTQEFIREARRSGLFDDSQRELLADFLRSADMVKFALHRPPREECRQAAATASDFVVRTTPVPASPGASPPAPPAAPPAEAAA